MATHQASEWPGLNNGGKEVIVDPDKLEEVAKELERLMERYTSGAGSPRRLQQSGKITSGDVGNWSVAQALVSSSDEIYSALGTFYDEFVQQLQNAIGSLRATKANYEGADQATTTTAGNTAQPGGQPPTTAPAW